MIKEALDKLSYAVFPKRCELCGEIIELDEIRCEECRSLKRISGELCNKCGNIKSNCRCKRNERTPEYKAFIAPFYYEKSVAAAANRFKDYGYPELSKAMGREMAQHISEHFGNIGFDCITFVPMSKKKQEKRGYNQAQLLAEEISIHLGVPSKELIAKTSKTPDQKRQSARERRMNLHGAFDLISGEEVDEKVILLIDDIKTTGSTLNECAYVLNAYGARAVYACTFCMTKKN